MVVLQVPAAKDPARSPRSATSVSHLGQQGMIYLPLDRKAFVRAVATDARTSRDRRADEFLATKETRMIVIWRGLGILAPFIVLAALVVTQMVVDALMGEGAYSASGRAQALAGCLGGALTAGLGWWLNRPRTLILDADTGEHFTIRSNHSLFWVPMQYWGFLVLAISFLSLLLAGD